jgi:hypothetical protein
VLSIISERADEITGTLSSLVLSKIASLWKSGEIAKYEGTVFANRLVETHADSRVNIKTLNFSLKRLRLSSRFWSPASAKLNSNTFSTSQSRVVLSHSSRSRVTPDEYAEGLFVLEKRM